MQPCKDELFKICNQDVSGIKSTGRLWSLVKVNSLKYVIKMLYYKCMGRHRNPVNTGLVTRLRRKPIVFVVTRSIYLNQIHVIVTIMN